LDPFAQIKRLPEQQKDKEIIIALGLALIGINRNNKVLNFLAADKAKEDRTARMQKNVIVFVILITVLIATFLFNLFSQLKTLENENQQLERKMKEVFIQTIPEEKRIVNELAQMTENFKVLEDEYNIIANEVYARAPALRILQCISKTITPGQNISVSSISINTNMTQLNGVAPSFESIDNMVSVLSKISEFDSVNIKNADIDTTNNRVRFSLLIKTSENLN
jgi:type II secretory pathway component PulL